MLYLGIVRLEFEKNLLPYLKLTPSSFVQKKYLIFGTKNDLFEYSLIELL